MKITVAGCGYVGLVTSVCLANKGHTVIGLDIDSKKIDQLNQGISPIYEKGLEDLIKTNLNKNLFFTENFVTAYNNSEIIFIAVATPENQDGSANIELVMQIALDIAKTVIKPTILVIKSTVPIGTNSKIMRKIEKITSVKIAVISNPEFLSQGTAVKDMMNPSRIVIGYREEWAKIKLNEIYKDFESTIVFTDCNSAEMIKYASNDFLALKISYINEIANLCEIVGANVSDVAFAMGLDERIGKHFLHAGIGYGGSCFPKDTKALHWIANYYDYEIKTIKAAIEVNENQKLRLIKKARKYFDSFEGVTISVLGLTFKPNTDDLREAPSRVIVPKLLEEGSIVQVYDPAGMSNFKKIFKDRVLYCNSALEALSGADICFILTEWDEIKNLSINEFKSQMVSPIILDGRNCLKIQNNKNSDVIIESIGM